MDPLINLLLKIWVALLVLAIVAIVVSIYRRIKLKRYKKVTLNMTEEEMLSIMGRGFNKSTLKDNRVKYEWRINASSYSSKGIRTYSGVRKVDIYVKDGLVEEIKPHNV